MNENTKRIKTLTIRQLDPIEHIHQLIESHKGTHKTIWRRQNRAQVSERWRMWKCAARQLMLAVVGIRFRFERNHLREIGSRQRLNDFLVFDQILFVCH